MTRQEVFNTAYLGILAQGVPGVDPDKGCAYEYEGLHCGIGFIIKPFVEDWDEFHEGDDQTGVEGLLEDKHFKQFHLDFLAEDVSFYDELQAAHDHAWLDVKFEVDGDFLTAFKQRMSIIAAHYNLEVPA